MKSATHHSKSSKAAKQREKHQQKKDLKCRRLSLSLRFFIFFKATDTHNAKSRGNIYKLARQEAVARQMIKNTQVLALSPPGLHGPGRALRRWSQ